MELRIVALQHWLSLSIITLYLYDGIFSQLCGCRRVVGGVHRGHGEQRGGRIPPELEVSGARLLQVRHLMSLAKPC